MKAPSGRAQPLASAGFAVFLAGCIAWAWTGEWRWAATGLAVFMMLVVLAAYLDGRRNSLPKRVVMPDLKRREERP